MTRALYFFGGLFAMAMILIATMDVASPMRAGLSVQTAAATPVAAPDPTAAAIDALAAWPAIP